MNQPITVEGPHKGQPVLVAGAAPEQAQSAMIMLHGRGAAADDILSLADHLGRPDILYLAPQAADYSWYPNRFIAPLASNEPWLGAALAVVGELLGRLDGVGIAAERTVLLGFSQGACLALEYAARNTRRYGGLVGLSGGLIGPDGTPRDYPGSLEGTPVFLGCSDVDFHIPLARVQESTQVLRRLGSDVTERIYPGMGHTVNQDELDAVRGMLASLVGA